MVEYIRAYSRRSSRNLSLSFGDTSDSLECRRLFLEGLGIDYRSLVCVKQTHGDNVRYVNNNDRGRGALSYDAALDDTDALVTDQINLPLAIFTADCLSVFLYDSLSPVIGLVHAGWRSSQKNISGKTVKLMQDKFKTQPSNIKVSFGPCIRSCCYEVGKDFKSLFPGGLAQRQGRIYLDLAAINRKQLLNLGVSDDNIFDPGICTSCSSVDFFSFRKEGKNCGRMISVAMLR